jgi:hypothetical protein
VSYAQIILYCARWGLDALPWIVRPWDENPLLRGFWRDHLNRLDGTGDEPLDRDCWWGER